MADSEIIASMTVADVLSRWPETAEVFNRHNMACVGCPVAPFYTIAEAAAKYNLTTAEFTKELEQVIKRNVLQ